MVNRWENAITRNDGDFEEQQILLNRVRNGQTRYFTETDKPDPEDFGIGIAWIDGAEHWSDGAQFNPKGVISSTTYNGDGTIATASINGSGYVFTYAGGKISTVVHAGITKTYNWSGDELTSVIVS